MVLASLGLLLGAGGFLLYSRLRVPNREAVEVSQAAAHEAARKLTELTSPSHESSPSAFEFSEKEINSYLRYQISGLYPKGLDEVRIHILDNAIRAEARINFDDLQSGIKAGKMTVMSSLFSGVHEIDLVGKLNARDGGGRYEILGCSLDHTEIPKPLVDLLVKKYLIPKYPDAAPDKTFALPYGIDKIECNQGKLAIYKSAP